MTCMILFHLPFLCPTAHLGQYSATLPIPPESFGVMCACGSPDVCIWGVGAIPCVWFYVCNLCVRLCICVYVCLSVHIAAMPPGFLEKSMTTINTFTHTFRMGAWRTPGAESSWFCSSPSLPTADCPSYFLAKTTEIKSPYAPSPRPLHRCPLCACLPPSWCEKPKQPRWHRRNPFDANKLPRHRSGCSQPFSGPTPPRIAAPHQHISSPSPLTVQFPCPASEATEK